MIEEFKKTLKLLTDRKNTLMDKISSANNQEEINQILNNIYEIDKKIKEYNQYTVFFGAIPAPKVPKLEKLRE